MFSVRFEKTWTVLSVFVLILQVIAEALTVAIIVEMNMLPFKYVGLIIALMAVLALVVGLFLFVRIDREVGVARRVAACVLALLLVCFCAYVAKNVVVAHKVIQTVTQQNAVEAKTTDGKNMYVLVRGDDPAKTLKDTANYAYGVIEGHDVVRVQKFTEWIAKEIGKTPEPTGYVQSSALIDALFNKQIDAVIMNGATIGLLLEEDGYESVLDKVQIMASVPFTVLEGKPPQAEKPVVEQIDPEKNVTNTPFVVYISGSDTRSSVLDVSRSDVNILMVVNPTTKQILLLNTPRDFYVENPYYEALDKLTHCGLFGVDNSMEALGDLYNTEIKYYAQINFTGFETLIDAIGGITVYSDQSFRSKGGTYFKKGDNELDGKKALDFARERYNVSGGDKTRGKNQMKMIEAVIKKMTSGTTLISKYGAIMSSLEGMFATNMQGEEISMLVKMQLNDLASWDIFRYAVTGFDGSEKTASMPGVYAYVTYPDQKTVDHAASLVEKVMTGVILKQEDVELPE